tara:strand:+ start:61 stop:306 length:246 start_codon:yes stop_codon:yes gene_type:complete
MKFNITKNPTPRTIKGYFKTGQLWLKTYLKVEGQDEYIFFEETGPTLPEQQPVVQTVSPDFLWEEFDFTPIHNDEEVNITL